jgi:hypothetical protein
VDFHFDGTRLAAISNEYSKGFRAISGIGNGGKEK